MPLLPCPIVKHEPWVDCTSSLVWLIFTLYCFVTLGGHSSHDEMTFAHETFVHFPYEPFCQCFLLSLSINMGTVPDLLLPTDMLHILVGMSQTPSYWIWHVRGCFQGITCILCSSFSELHINRWCVEWSLALLHNRHGTPDPCLLVRVGIVCLQL